MLEELFLLLAKKETEEGTDAVPTAAANSLKVWGVKIKEVVEPAERPGMAGSLSPLASKMGSVYVEITFNAELKGSGTKGVAPRIGCLLQACGRAEGAVVGSSVSYLPKSTGVSTVTIYLYKGGDGYRLHKLTGAKGNAKVITPANKVGYVEFSMKGLYTPPTDSDIPSGISLESTIAPVCKGGSVSLNSVTTLEIENSELDFGNKVAMRPSKVATYGVAGFTISSRTPTLSINPKAVSISTLDIRALMMTTPVAYTEVVGATAGNIVTISVPKFNLLAPEYEDREGVTTEKLTGECTKNADAGNDEQSIIFT